jgi:hypothetical protein
VLGADASDQPFNLGWIVVVDSAGDATASPAGHFLGGVDPGRGVIRWTR